MRVALIAPEFIPAWGGAGTYAYNLAKGLSKYQDIEVHVITPKRGLGYDKQALESLFDGKVKIHNISTASDSFFYNLRFQLELFSQFEKLHKKFNFDIVHSTGLVHMPDVLLRLKKLSIPTLVTVHTTIDSQFDYKPNFAEFLLKGEPVEFLSMAAYPGIKLLQNRYVKGSDGFICVSDYVRRFIPTRKKLEVINNGIDTGRFCPGENSKFKFLDNIRTPKIIFCGRLLYMKGIKTLIEAAKLVLKEFDVHFIFAGQGNFKKWYSHLRGIEDKILFLGYVDYQDMHYLYQKCDIFVLPSFIESFPMTLLEAMSCGLAPVASDVGGIPEIIEDGKNGLLFSSHNSADLAKKLNKLLADKSLLRKIGINARDTVETKFTSSTMTLLTRDMYYNMSGEMNA
ncbi:MAG: glycosyltransferase family 4 protein [archaeon]